MYIGEGGGYPMYIDGGGWYPMYIWEGGGGTLCTFWAEIENRAGVPSAEGSPCQLHPAWSAGWTLSGRT